MPVKEGVDIETGGAGDAEMRRDEIEDQKAPNGTWWSRTLSLLVQKVRGTQCTHTMQVVAQERVLCSRKRTRRSCPKRALALLCGFESLAAAAAFCSLIMMNMVTSA